MKFLFNVMLIMGAASRISTHVNRVQGNLWEVFTHSSIVQLGTILWKSGMGGNLQ